MLLIKCKLPRNCAYYNGKNLSPLCSIMALIASRAGSIEILIYPMTNIARIVRNSHIYL